MTHPDITQQLTICPPPPSPPLNLEYNKRGQNKFILFCILDYFKHTILFMKVHIFWYIMFFGTWDWVTPPPLLGNVSHIRPNFPHLQGKFGIGKF